jgi:hypothetical protein
LSDLVWWRNHIVAPVTEEFAFRWWRSSQHNAWGPFLTSPLGANFDPQGRSCPQGVNLYPRGAKLSPGGEIICSPLNSSKQILVFRAKIEALLIGSHDRKINFRVNRP